MQTIRFAMPSSPVALFFAFLMAHFSVQAAGINPFSIPGSLSAELAFEEGTTVSAVVKFDGVPEHTVFYEEETVYVFCEVHVPDRPDRPVGTCTYPKEKVTLREFTTTGLSTVTLDTRGYAGDEGIFLRAFVAFGDFTENSEREVGVDTPPFRVVPGREEE